MINRFLSKQRQRTRLLGKTDEGIMRDYLSTPFPDCRSYCDELCIVALDLETTGLDPKRDSILSYGLVHLQHMSIRLGTSRHGVISVGREIPEESAIIHQITDDMAAQGRPLEEVLPELLSELAGRVMLVHYARIEQNFLDTACRRLYGVPFLIPTIDTLVLAQRLLEIRNHTIQSGNLRLFNLRPQYNLPQYKAHNALSDALATAELFLALAADMYPDLDSCRLDRFLDDRRSWF